jgi:hypothetical protein
MVDAIELGTIRATEGITLVIVRNPRRVTAKLLSG